MQQKLWKKAAAFAKQGHVRKAWQRVVSGLTCIVVFCTTYALILPAITMEGDALCTLPEHTHTEECYAQNNRMVLTCNAVHSHDQSCYGSDGTLICGQADFVMHSHNGLCYDDAGQLRCELPQVTEHVGESGAYYIIEGTPDPVTPAHVHSEGCYTAQRGALQCTLTEGSVHVHGTECYGAQVAACGLEETEAHWHAESCYENQLTCGTEEADGHAHTESCYDGENLICGQEEAAAHQHSAQCYTRALICVKTEGAGHTHNASCMQTPLICTLSEDIHFHTDSCYEMIQVLSCGKLALQSHTHSEACLQQAEKTLVCEKEEHTHTLICYSNPDADVETKAYWEATMKDADLTGGTADDLLAIAKTQLGYTESKLNYTVLEDGITTKGYTRYGAWAGTPYADWNELFVEFCLYYAGIDEEDFPRAEQNKTWRKTLTEEGLFYTEGTPEPGDLLFLEKDEDAYDIGIVTNISTEGYITAILGDWENEVHSETFTPGDLDILGYTPLPELPEEPADNAGETATVLAESVETTEEVTEPEEATASTEEAATEYDNEPLQAVIDIGLIASETAVETVEETPVMATFSLRSAGIQTYADTAYPDMSNFINADEFFVYYKQKGETTWTPLKSDVTVEKGTQIRYELGYTIPKGTLSAENNIVTYQIPLSVTNLDETGFVYSGAEKVGTYAIDDNGLMTITYYPDFAADNQTKPITGTIRFEALVDQVADQTTGELEIDTAGGDKYTISIKNDQTIYNDLKVAKASEIVDEENGIIKYTLTVTSENGTAGIPVDLKDWMGNNTYFEGAIGETTYGSITVVDGSNNKVTYTGSPVVGEDDFVLELPAMAAGESYTITYYAKVTSANQGTTKPSNSVHVDATDGDKKYHGEDYIDTTFDFSDNPLNKTHVVNPDGSVTWTITIDADKANGLNGWTLGDTMSDELDEISISYTDNNQTVYENISLPYTFSKNYSGIVTITYTSVMDYQLGQNGYYNTAKLTPPDGVFKPEYSESEHAPYPNGTYNPLDKQLVGSDKNYKYLEWSLTLGNNPEVVVAPWTITDELSSNQYYTVDQQNDIRSKIEVMLSSIYGSGFTNYKLEFFNPYSGVEGSATKFTLTVNENLPVIPTDTTYTIKYRSTPDLGEGDRYLYFNNTAHFNTVQDSAGTSYNPVLNKWDGSWSTGSTIKDLSTSDLNELVWYVELKITQDMIDANKDLIITEDIPDNLSPNYFRLDWDDNYKVDPEQLETDGRVTVGGYIIERIVTDGNVQYVIKVPKELVAQKRGGNVALELRFPLPDDYVPSEYPDDDIKFMHDSYTNRVSVSYDGEEPFAETEQTQTVIDPSITTGQDTETTEKIVKYIGTPGNNELPYVIQINHKGEDLNPDGEWLKVEDILSFVNDQSDLSTGKIQAELDPESVYITIYNADGTSTRQQLKAFTGSEVVVEDLTGSTYVPSSSLTLSEDKKSETAEHVITFYVPDDCFIKLEYTYKFRGSGSTEMTNIAKVTSYGTEYAGQDKTEFEVKDVGVTAEVSKLNIQKVDAANTAKPLAGAVYELYEYVQLKDEDGKAILDENGKPVGEWEFIHIVKSKDDGSLVLGTEAAAADTDTDIAYVIEAETAYYLVEIQAPVVTDGEVTHQYVLDETRHYFVVKDKAENTVAFVPDNFPVNAYYNSDSKLTITNEYGEKTISVNKKWLNAAGQTINPPADASVTIQLNQILTYDNPEAEDITYGEDATVEITVGNNSYVSNIYNQKHRVKTGDIISITYKNVPLDPTVGTDSTLPGLMDTRFDTANYHIPYTATPNGEGTWDYTFKLKVRRDTTLRGWVYDLTKDVSVTIDPYDPATDTPVEDTAEKTYTTVFSGDDWSESWANLPKYKLDDHGRIEGYYIYEFEEIKAPEGYVTDITTNGNSTTITNSLPKDTELTVAKDWNVEEGTTTPESISFTLYRVTHEEDPSSELIDVVFQVYNKIENVDVLLWNKTVRVPVGTTVKFGFSNSDDSYWVVGSENKVGAETDPNTGNKWIYYQATAENDMTVKAYANVEPTGDNEPIIDIIRTVTGEPYEITPEDKDGIYYLTVADNWTKTFESLPLEGMMTVNNADGTTTQKHVYYSYYVAESLPGYETSYKVYDDTYSICPTITIDGTEITIVNTEVEDDMIGIKVEKKWIDANGDPLNASAMPEIEFKLIQLSTDDSGSGSGTTEPTFVLEVCGGEWGWDEYYTKLSDVKSGDTYRIVFVGAADAECTDRHGESDITLVSKEYIGEIESEIIYKYTYDATMKNDIDYQDPYIVCEYGISSNTYTFSDGTSVVVGMVGDPVKVTSTSGDGTDESEGTLIGTYSLNATNNWTWTSGRLEPGTYKVEEVTEGYTVTYTVNGESGSEGTFEANSNGSFVITNQLTEETTDIIVNKEWLKKDGTPFAVNGVDSIQFCLKRSVGEEDPVVVDTYTLTKDTGWKRTISGLPKTNSDSEVYTYTVEEIAIEGYDSSVKKNEDGSFTITNQVEETAYELPKTGGAGVFPYTLGGVAMCGVAVLRYKPKKRRKEDKDS